MSSQERFGYEWAEYSEIMPIYEEQFKNWIGPIKPEDFKGKKILDAGCGMGRNSYWPLTYGAESVTAFDFDERSVASAGKNLSKFKNATVLFKSIYEIEWKNDFDIVICIGVLHHLARPREALKKFYDALKDGGKLIVWVYSFEDNEWIVKFVNPIRKSITSKLPVGLIHFISYFCSIPLWFFAKIFKGPSIYLKQLSGFSFSHIHSIVFDQLIPDVANYWKKEEVERLFGDFGFKQVNIYKPSNSNGWTVIADK